MIEIVNPFARHEFGVVIAYILPGWTMCLAARRWSTALNDWLGHAGNCEATFGGFLYVVLASIGAGLTCSTLRWLILDGLHHRTGIVPPRWNLGQLGKKAEAFELLIEIHYRYYQFYGNMIVALGVVLVSDWFARSPFTIRPQDLVIAALLMLFYLGSRDALRKYYQRVDRMLR